jgi:hypothetical protein
MKNRLIILLITLSVSLSSHAATCPPAETLDPEHPPMGWSLLAPPIFEDQHYHFGKAVHSLNGSFYYLQVICEYETCPTFGCPKFSILSADTYETPNTDAAPWQTKPVIGYTVVCQPPNHDSFACSFQ